MQNTTAAARRLGIRAALRPGRTISPSLRTYATPVPVENANDMAPEDYPDVPFVSKHRRPAKGWTDPQMRRNFGEPLHENEEVISMWGPDAPVVPKETALRHFTLAFLGIASFGLAVKLALVPERPAVPREYPYSGLIKELGGLEENKARLEDESAEED